MTDLKMDSPDRQGLRNRLKRIPGLVAGVRHLRALWRRGKIALIARALAWGRATYARRLLVFESLPDQLVLAVHPQESYVLHASDRVVGRSLYVGG